MKTPINHPGPARIRLLWLALALFLAGCPQPPDEPQPPHPPPAPPVPEVVPCSGNCELIITLPADPALPPTVSVPEFNVKQGVNVNIVLVDEGNRPNQAATVLRFKRGQEAFLNPGGRPAQTVALPQAGPHTYEVRSHDDGVCTVELGGCKYDVVNEGNRGRPELDPDVYIWP